MGSGSPLRIRRQLGHQYRQRLPRRRAIQLKHLGFARRRPVRAVGRTRHQGSADRRGRAGARHPGSWRLARVRRPPVGPHPARRHRPAWTPPASTAPRLRWPRPRTRLRRTPRLPRPRPLRCNWPRLTARHRRTLLRHPRRTCRPHPRRTPSRPRLPWTCRRLPRPMSRRRPTRCRPHPQRTHRPSWTPTSTVSYRPACRSMLTRPATPSNCGTRSGPRTFTETTRWTLSLSRLPTPDAPLLPARPENPPVRGVSGTAHHSGGRRDYCVRPSPPTLRCRRRRIGASTPVAAP